MRSAVTGLRGLRARLVVVTLALLTLGLATADVAAYVVLRNHLIGRIDANLALTQEQLQILAERGNQRGLDALERVAPRQVLLVYIDADGNVIDTANGSVRARPDVTAEELIDIPVGEPTTVEEAAGDRPYRMARVDLAGAGLVVTTASGAVVVEQVVVGLPVSDANDALQLLVVTEIVSGTVVLLAGSALAWWALRLGLRPLRQMARTARAIAGGDHDERIHVPTAGPELTEVAEALNSAFDARTASEQGVREFLADASHELRTPLAVVHGWSDLYLEGGLSDWASVDDAMGHINRETARMRALVEDMLTLARLGAPAERTSEPVPLTPLVTAIADAVGPLHPDKELVVTGAPVIAYGDRDAFHRAILNLVTNACRHTPAGTVITIATRAAATWVEVVVEDDGPGLSDDQRARALDRFWRGGHSGAAGSGLGLAISRAALRAHDGDLRLEPVVPHGLRCVVALPAAPAADQRTGS